MAQIAYYNFDMEPYKLFKIYEKLYKVTLPLARTQSVINSLNKKSLFMEYNMIAKINSSIISPKLLSNIKQLHQVNKTMIPQISYLIKMPQWSKIIDSYQGPLLDNITDTFLAGYERADAINNLTTFADKFIITDISNEEEPDQTDSLTAEEESIVNNELSEALKDKQNWQQRLMESVAKFKETNPFIAQILEKIVFVLIMALAQQLIVLAIGNVLKPAKVYEGPQASSTVVQIINPQQVNIIGDAPYFYQVEISDESGNKVVGYLSKRVVEVGRDKN